MDRNTRRQAVAAKRESFEDFGFVPDDFEAEDQTESELTYMEAVQPQLIDVDALRRVALL